jgi:protein-S-isoprenylcysteine O-methyltransferase Ste14
MTPLIAKTILIAGAITWFIIRWPHQRRSWKTPIAKNERTTREKLLLLSNFLGLGVIPFVYAFTGFPRFADYTFQPALAIVGAVIMVLALVLFYRVHRELGRNWSDSLQVRETHSLVTDGLYRYVRHPMYSAFFLWGLAQLFLLPNWIAGPAGLVGFAILFGFRVGREEQMMIEAFGDQYRAYMSRTARIIPWLY